MSREIVRFGVFEADLAAGELRNRGHRVRIQDLPFRALKILVSRPNEVLSRDDFRQALWPDDVFVDFEGGITTAIKRLRDALGDSAANPIFVETVGRRGYRWIAPLHSPEMSPPKLSLVSGGGGLAENADVIAATPASKSRRFLLLAIVILTVVSMAGIYRGASHWRKAVSNSNSKSVSVSNLPHPVSSLSGHRQPANREAADFYLQGRYYWNQRTPDSLNKALDAFTQAIVHDPGYSDAYVGLADCYNLLREYSVMPSTEAYPRALAAAKKAVELDDQSSQAHASLAFVSFFGMWDAATADREFRRAIELDPNNGVAHHWYATYLHCLRRYPEALTEIERAQALDPTSNSIVADRGSILFNSGHSDEAVTLLKQVEETAPNFVSPHRALAGIYLLHAEYPDYLIEARKWATLLHDKSELAVVAASEHAFAAGGGRAMLQAMLQEQKKLYDHKLLSPVAVAGTSMLLGHKKEALFYLQAAYSQHADTVAEVESSPVFHNGLHDEPAYGDLVAKIGLPPLR